MPKNSRKQADSDAESDSDASSIDAQSRKKSQKRKKGPSYTDDAGYKRLKVSDEHEQGKPEEFSDEELGQINKAVFNTDTTGDFDEADRQNMPVEGIMSHGVLFHHRFPYKLKETHMRRLAAHGIILQKGLFSPEEDERLLKNWAAFSKDHGIDSDDAPFYFGWGKSFADNEIKNLKVFIRNTGMHPAMCKGLHNRSAYQVARRCYFLFNPFKNDEADEWDEEKDQKLLALHAKYGPKWQMIATKLQTVRYLCQSRYKKLTSSKTKALDSEKVIRDGRVLRLRVFQMIKKQLQHHPLYHIEKGDLEEVEAKIHWAAIAERWKLSEEACQKIWRRGKNKLNRFIKEHPDYADMSYSKIQSEVFGIEKPGRKFDLTLLYPAMKVLCDYAAETELQSLAKVDIVELNTRLDEVGIDTFSLRTTAHHLLTIVANFLKTVRKKNMLALLSPDATFVDQLQLTKYIVKKLKSLELRSLRKITYRNMLDWTRKFVDRKGWQQVPLTVVCSTDVAKLYEKDHKEGDNSDSEGDEGDDKMLENMRKNRKVEVNRVVEPIDDEQDQEEEEEDEPADDDQNQEEGDEEDDDEE